ncbi:unnamed protein product [Staurois parvus]|uniref:Uncharacterized protein n=1 Tax=Staurois parvus TaxID=386267 RepID=A0ABN9AAV3_9NEOB|nr:unnamed protein product [Staurois parvus]
MPVRAAPSPVTAESPPSPSVWTTAVPPSRLALAAVMSPVAPVALPASTSPLTVPSLTASAARLNCGDEEGSHHQPINADQGKQRCPQTSFWFSLCPSSQNPLQPG